MQITLEAVEKVMELTGVDYAAAKEALVKADGDVDEAVKLITPEGKKENDKVKYRYYRRYHRSSGSPLGICCSNTCNARLWMQDRDS